MNGHFLTLAVLSALLVVSLGQEVIETGKSADFDPDDYEEGASVVCTFEYQDKCEEACLGAQIKIDGDKVSPVEGTFTFALEDDVITVKNKQKDADLSCEVVDENGDPFSGTV